MLGSLTIAVNVEGKGELSSRFFKITQSTFITELVQYILWSILRCPILLVGLSGNHVHIWVCCVQNLLTEGHLRSRCLYCRSYSFLGTHPDLGKLWTPTAQFESFSYIYCISTMQNILFDDFVSFCYGALTRFSTKPRILYMTTSCFKIHYGACPIMHFMAKSL